MVQNVDADAEDRRRARQRVVHHPQVLERERQRGGRLDATRHRQRGGLPALGEVAAVDDQQAGRAAPETRARRRRHAGGKHALDALRGS
jgi:hypothetical protein